MLYNTATAFPSYNNYYERPDTYNTYIYFLPTDHQFLHEYADGAK